MISLKVLNIDLLNQHFEKLHNFTLDCPKENTQTTSQMLNFAGWVVGQTSPAVMIEVLYNGQALLKSPVEIYRLKVAQLYKGIIGSDRSGFQGCIPVESFPLGEFEINIQVVLKDTSTIPVAVIKLSCHHKTMLKKTFFIHVAKTAGSSFNKFLIKNFWGDDHCEKYRKNGRQTEFLYLEKLHSFDYISGHLTYREFQRDFERQHYFLVTLLRNPLHQVISHLNWVIHVSDDTNSDFFKNHPHHIQDISLDIRSRNLENHQEIIQVLLDYQGLFMNNQSRYFALKEKFDSQHIIKNLQNFDLVGLTENYDKFLMDFIKLQGTHVMPEFSQENQNSNPRVSKNEIIKNNEFIQLINEYNQIDMQVYNYFYDQEKQQQKISNYLIRLQQIHREIQEQKEKLHQIKSSFLKL